MNPLDYGSLEACKRLVDNGIVLETEWVWRKKRDKTGYYLSRKALYHRTSDIPAPCMAEVWRELPYGASIQKLMTCYARDHKENVEFEADNPTDALIDLLIWQRKEASHEG
jgi:hypothetical protein